MVHTILGKHIHRALKQNQKIQGLVNLQIKHHPTTGEIVSKKYIKVMSKIPQTIGTFTSSWVMISPVVGWCLIWTFTNPSKTMDFHRNTITTKILRSPHVHNGDGRKMRTQRFRNTFIAQKHPTKEAWKEWSHAAFLERFGWNWSTDHPNTKVYLSRIGGFKFYRSVEEMGAYPGYLSLGRCW